MSYKGWAKETCLNCLQNTNKTILMAERARWTADMNRSNYPFYRRNDINRVVNTSIARDDSSNGYFEICLNINGNMFTQKNYLLELEADPWTN